MNIIYIVAFSVATARADMPVVERTVSLRPAITIGSETICLSDLFEEHFITSKCDKNVKECCPWIVSENKQLTLTKQQTDTALARVQSLVGKVKVAGANEAKITQTHRELSKTELNEKIAKAFAAMPKHTGKWEILSIQTQSPVYLNLESPQWSVQLPAQPARISSVKIINSTQNGDVLSGWAQVRISYTDNVYIAKKNIRAGEQISLEDFENKNVDLLSTSTWNQDTSAAIQRGALPQGMRARYGIISGAPLLMSAIERTPVVTFGDHVTLVLRSENLKISTKGISQGSAAVGDTVSVQLKSYNRTFRGKVTDGKQVEVWL